MGLDLIKIRHVKMAVICERVKKSGFKYVFNRGVIFLRCFILGLMELKGDILALAKVCALLTTGQRWGSKIKMILHVAFSVGLIKFFCLFTAFADSKKNTEYHHLFFSNTE